MKEFKEKLEQGGKWINPYLIKSEEFADQILFNDSGLATAAATRRVEGTISHFPKLIVELGSGSGRHLNSLAEEHPSACVIGFELRFKRAVKTVEKARKRGLTNLFILRTTADNLTALFPPESIDRIYLNFPDPWDKDRWKKHRMLTTEKLNGFSRCLKQGGTFNFKTDHRGYFIDGREIFENDSGFSLTKYTEDLFESPYLEDNITTEFEQLFRSKGQPIFYLQAQKCC